MGLVWGTFTTDALMLSVVRDVKRGYAVLSGRIS